MDALTAPGFLAPLLLLAAALAAALRPGRRPTGIPRLAEAAAIGALLLAAADMVQLVLAGPATLGFGKPGSFA